MSIRSEWWGATVSLWATAHSEWWDATYRCGPPHIVNGGMRRIVVGHRPPGAVHGAAARTTTATAAFHAYRHRRAGTRARAPAGRRTEQRRAETIHRTLSDGI
ncbi:MAG: hypothetical protein HGA19_00850 [Oscillochloris sp.]|nr:hypothetical protein [Oscillochloris sp.]